ncbi:hypothetical protein ACFUMI_22160, partial [Streptomyces sp. NPDC057273]
QPRDHSGRPVPPGTATGRHVTTGRTLPDAALAVHSRAVGRGARIVDEKHWDGLPTGASRRVTTGDGGLPRPRRHDAPASQAGPLAALLNRAAVTQVEVGRRPLSVYDELTGTRPFTTKPSAKESS